MQSVSSRIWTRVAVSISYDDNHYTTGICLQIIIHLRTSNRLKFFKPYNNWCKWSEIDSNTLNYTIVNQLLVFDRNTWNHTTAQIISFKGYYLKLYLLTNNHSIEIFTWNNYLNDIRKLPETSSGILGLLSVSSLSTSQPLASSPHWQWSGDDSHPTTKLFLSRKNWLS